MCFIICDSTQGQCYSWISIQVVVSPQQYLAGHLLNKVWKYQIVRSGFEWSVPYEMSSHGQLTIHDRKVLSYFFPHSHHQFMNSRIFHWWVAVYPFDSIWFEFRMKIVNSIFFLNRWIFYHLCTAIVHCKHLLIVTVWFLLDDQET